MAQTHATQDRVNDFVIKLANVNGTGSASANSMLMKSIFRMGVPVMGKNYFPSNIQGLPTWYEIRVTKDAYVARSGRIDIMVAMNAETYQKDVREVSPGGFLIYDSTWPRSAVLVRDDITILGAPLAKLCNENFVGVRNRILMKNVVYLGLLAALLEIDVEVIRQLLTESFSKKPVLVEANMKAVQLGYDYAKQHLPCPLPLRIQRMDKTKGHVMIDGNTAAGLGAVYAGATVGPWYPITPSTSLMDAFKSFCSKLRVDPQTGESRYAVIQAEDELAAIGMVMGANWNGARAFTATSGPGISLMSEFIGLAYYAEIPAVIVDVQRVGPSTGMPTRTQQCDILMCAYASHGDTKHVLLFPSNPEECFYMMVQAFDLAERLQTPVFVMSDLDIGMNDWMCPELKWDDAYRPDRGKVLTKAEIEALPQVPSLPGQGRRRHSGAHAARRFAEGRVLHARLGSQPVRRLHRGLRGIPGRHGTPAAQVQAGQDARATAGHRSHGHQRHRPGRRRQLPRGGERGARHPRQARDRGRLHAHQGLPVHEGGRIVHGLARQDLRGRAEPGRAAALIADARDRRAEVETALDPALQRPADDLEGNRRGRGRGTGRRANPRAWLPQRNPYPPIAVP
jgi:Pyruvate/2-oxoacid:ferredoxin oxidoreductase gamma subunit